jgi:hypothetical protein
MFRLGGQSSDGVGITSGLNRKNYGYGDKYLGQLEESFEKSNKALEGYGRPSKGEFAIGLSDILRQGGSIYDMITNAQETVLPMYKDYKTKQAMIEPLKFKNLATMAGLGIKSDAASKETATAMKLRLGNMALELDLSDPANQKKYDLWMRISKGTGHITKEEALQTATEIFYKSKEFVENTPKSKHRDTINSIAETFYSGEFAQGGRVGLQNSFPGTVEEASMAEQIQTPAGVEDITENEEVIAEGQEMGGPKQDPFVILRARLPKEITDDVVKLIAYNPDAFKDFAAIETQQDVINFNETYGVELVLPTEQV